MRRPSLDEVQRYAGGVDVFNGYDPRRLALDHNATTDYCDITDGHDANPAGVGPLEIFATANALVVGTIKTSVDSGIIFSFGDTAVGNTYWRVGVLAGGNLYVQDRNLDTASIQPLVDSGVAVDDGAHHRFAAVISSGGGNSVIGISVDGSTPVYSTAYATASSCSQASPDAAAIGRLERNTPVLYWTGRWSDIQVLQWSGVGATMQQLSTLATGWQLTAPYWPGSLFNRATDQGWWLDWVPGATNPAPPLIYSCAEAGRQCNATMKGSLVAGDIVEDPQA